MGSAAEIELLGGDDSMLEFAERRLRHLEQCWSRFIESSDVSRLNAAQGDPVIVDPSTITLLEAMVHGRHATDGAFDPTVLAAVIDLGYAASRHDASRRVALPYGIGRRSDLSGVHVVRGDEDDHGRVVGTCVAQMPAGTAIDPGGIGKGLAADLVAHELLRAGATGAMVSVGGDLRVAGTGPNDGDWVIAILADDEIVPGEPARVGWIPTRHVVDHVRLRDGGVATSGTIRHQVDPDRSSRAVVDDDGTRLLQASVVASSATWAEVCATWAMVRGRDILDHLDCLSVGVRLQYHDGTVATTSAWHHGSTDVAAPDGSSRCHGGDGCSILK